MDTVRRNEALESPFQKLEVGDGGGGMNAICSRSEEADDVISGGNVDTYLQQFSKNLNQSFM